jgi:hypothetical protein
VFSVNGYVLKVKMSQNSKSNKVCLIVNDFKDRLPDKVVFVDEIFDFMVPKIDNTYLTLYEDCSDYKKLFTFFTKT